MTKFKKIVSMILLISILLPLIPIGEIIAFAQSGVVIPQMTINYTYKERDETQLDKISFYITARIDTKGTYDIKVRDSKGTEHTIGRITIDDNNVDKLIYPSFELRPKDNIRINQIYIGGQIINISGPTLNPTPKITKMQTYDVLLGENLRFEGENLNAYGSTMTIEGLGQIVPNSATEFSQPIMTGNPGYKTINFEVRGSHSQGGEVIQNVTYPNAFKLMGTLKELGDQPGDYLEIIPEMGEKESVAYIRANNGQFNVKDGVGEYSVFFLTDTTDKYSVNNMAEIISYSQNRKVMKIKIPKGIQDSKSYEVQVTNRVKDPKGNIDAQVLERKAVKNKYFVIGADKSPVITSITPAKGPDTGEVVRIGGKKFDEVDFIDGFDNIQEVKHNEVLIEDKILDNVIGDIIGSEGIDTDNRQDKVFHIKYDVGGSTTYNNSKVHSINRYIAVYVGDRTTPHTVNDKPVYSFDEVYDSLSVRVPSSNVNAEKQVNVIVIIQTEIETDEGTRTIVNIVTNDNIKYTIIPSHTRPSITKIIPEQIQVVQRGIGYGLKEDMVITIEGQNFKVLRSRDNTTGKDVTNYPIVGIGANLENSDDGIVLRMSPEKEGQVEIYKNNKWETISGANITILDSKGNIIDGTIGKDVGNKIIISLPKNADINLPTDSVTTDRSQPIPKPVYVMNPVLGSQKPGEPVSNDNVAVMFIDLKDNPSPTIDTVTPNVVAIDSGEEIIVTGSNFQQGARVFLGGVEVTGVKQELDPSGLNTILKFNAPKFPQIIDGPTKIMVMNPDGGIAVKDFTFVKSLQRDPILTSFSPKSGTLDTVVVIDGDNFLAPNPSVVSITGMGIHRLIGSRVLMDGKDINEYNRDINGNIVLQPYTNSSEMLIASEHSVAKLSSYAHSVILVDRNNQNKFFTIYNDNRMNIFLSDGGSGAEENNIINLYNIRYENGDLIAEKGGQTYRVDVSEDGLKLFQGSTLVLDLVMKTPYKFSGEDIYGSRVQVKDKNRIEFRVPPLVSKLPSGYTITVENPDTKKSIAKDLFYYYETVSLKPQITEIKPSIGSIDGGYQILIEGKNFEDNSKVYVDGALVPQSSIKREIRGGVDTLIITSMPPYRRNMNEEGTDRKLVPVTVENGNGGTALGRFTYVIPPSARPVIDKAEFQKENQIGSAAGEEILTITGKYFKFEEPWALTPKYSGWIEGERNGVKVFYEDLNGDGEYTSYTSWLNYDGAKEKLLAPVETYTEYLTSPILPTVRIGGIEARIVEFGDGYIRVITPQIAAGKQELYVVNNDFGTSNKVVLSFEGSKITINKIVGDIGKKQGKDSVEISGTGFQNTRLYVMEKGQKKEYNMPLVRFGTIGDTKDINNNMAQITLENGDFTLDYNNTSITSAIITLTAKYDKEIYKKTFTIDGYDGSPIYLPIWELENTDKKFHPGYELIRIEVKNRKLVAAKGYSPETKLVNSGLISLQTPSYYTIGDVQVEVTNPDGGRATTKYKYTNPASKPKITNITRDGKDPEQGDDGNTRIIRLDYRGGQNITVLGEDFREGATIQIGNILKIENKDITETLNAAPNKLAFTMPGVNENVVGNLYRVTVTNGDGAQVSSDNPNNMWNAPIYIQFIKGESEPGAGNIEPNKGPATGGTKVTIKGKDFRKNMEGYGDNTISVFFGGVEVPAKDILEITDTTIKLITPPSPKLGPVKVTIENPDGTLTQDNLIFTYISKPKINDVSPKKLFTNDTKTVVTIDGIQFLPGAKVIVGGKIIPTKDVKPDMQLKGQGITGVDKDGNNIESSVIGGMEAATVQVVSENQIKVTFAEATDLENTSLIIINPDGGISDPYNDFKYEKPLPLKPMVLEGIPGYESTVMLIWNKSDPDLLNRATDYEIYGRKTKDSANTFVGTTSGAEYLVKGLEPNTEYTFMVRALNEHGAAIDFATVTVKTLSIQEDYKQKEKEDKLKEDQKNIELKGKETIEGNKVIRTLGSDDIKNGLGFIDFTLTKYKGANEYIIKIPLALARTDSALNIKDGTMTMTINPKDMYTYKVSTMDEGDKDSNLQIVIKKGRETNIPRGKKVASILYDIDFLFQRGKDTISIDKLLRSGKLTLDLDTLLYTNTKNVYLGVFNISTGTYEKAGEARTVSFNQKGKYLLISDK